MKSRLKANWLVVLFLLTGLSLGIVVASRLTAQTVQARSAHDPSTMSVFTCTIQDVGVFIERVHVRCTTSVVIGANTIWWWSYPNSDSATASRFLSLFETAKATGTTVTVFYDPNDLTGSTFGCYNSDCRRIWGATSS